MCRLSKEELSNIFGKLDDKEDVHSSHHMNMIDDELQQKHSENAFQFPQFNESTRIEVKITKMGKKEVEQNGHRPHKTKPNMDLAP